MSTRYEHRPNNGNATTTVAIITPGGAISTTDNLSETAFAEQQVIRLTHCGSSGTVYARVIGAATAKGSNVSSSLFDYELTTSNRSEYILKPREAKVLLVGSGTIACSVATQVETT